MADARDSALVEGMVDWTLEQLAPLTRSLDNAHAVDSALSERLQALEDRPAPDLDTLAGSIAALGDLLMKAQAELHGEVSDVAAALAPLTHSLETAHAADSALSERVRALEDQPAPDLDTLAGSIAELGSLLTKAQAELHGEVSDVAAALAPLTHSLENAHAAGSALSERLRALEDQPAPDLDTLAGSIAALGDLLTKAQAELHGEVSDVAAALAQAGEQTGDWLQRMGARVDALADALGPLRDRLEAAAAEQRCALDELRAAAEASEDRIASNLNAALTEADQAGEQAAAALETLSRRVTDLEAGLAALRPSLDAAAAQYTRAVEQAVADGTVALQERVIAVYADLAEVQRHLHEIEPEPGPPGEKGEQGPPGTFADIEPYAPGRIYRAGEAVACHARHPDRWAMAVAVAETYEPPEAACPDWRVLAYHGAAGAPGAATPGPAGPGFTFRGVFREGIYQSGDVVIAPSGSLFLCERERIYTDCPQDGWRLFLKQGKRGSPGRAGLGIADIAFADGALQIRTTDQRRTVLPLFPQNASPLLFRGVYAAAANYARGDVVAFGGATWLATAPTSGLTPNLAPDVWLPMGGRSA